MGQIGSLWYSIGSKTDGLEKGLANSKAKLTNLSNSFKSITGVGLGAASVFTAAGKALQFVVNEAMEAEKAEKRLETVLNSTNYAAGMSKESLMGYATSLSRVTANSQEAIMYAESLMLTFTNIGKNVFPDAMNAALDMSAAFGGDLQSSVIQLGKALNDPSGMAAMKRIGVSFSEAQIEMAKELYETGKIAEYQRLILSELNTEVGGMAEAMGTTYAGQVQILKNNFGELGETVGKVLIPYLVDAAKALNGLLTVQSYWEEMVAGSDEWMSKAGITYEDYTNRIIDTAIATGNMTKRQKEFYELYSKNTDQASLAWITNMNDKIGIVSKTTYDAIPLTDSWVGVWENAHKIMEPTVIVTEEMAEAMAKLENEALSAGLSGEIQDTADAYLELVAANDAATKGHWNSKKALGEMEQAEQDAYQAIVDTTTALMNETIMQGLSGDAALEMARSLGILSEADYAATKEAQAIASAYDGTAESAEIAAGKVSELSSWIAGLESKNITVTTTMITIHKNVVAGQVYNPAEVAANKDLNNNGVIGAAKGADFWTSGPQMMMVGEGGQPEHVQVTPAKNESNNNGFTRQLLNALGQFDPYENARIITNQMAKKGQ